MSVGSFSSGLSGLNANSQYLSVIGNNLANINTVGFKASAITFADLVSQNFGGSSIDPMQVGLGVTTGSITPTFSQGTIESTKEATNVAIQGNGFFVVKQPTGATAYTRAGAFSFDSEGKLVTPQGYLVQGYTTLDSVTGQVVPGGPTTDITVPPGVLRAPVETTSINTGLNLDASATTGTTYQVGVQIYDGLGEDHVMTLTFTKAAGAGAWDYDITVPGEDVTGPGVGGAPVPPVSLTTGSLAFDAVGNLATIGGAAAADVPITTPTWFNGAATTTVNWDVVNNNGVASINGFQVASDTLSISQNGSPAGKIENISINGEGTILATFGTGRSVPIGQLALANFNNPKGLIKLGENNYGESEAAGLANIGVPGSSGRGTLIGSALEQSNVDIAQEFTQMILAQRGYQANSKMISVSDEILVDTLNLKR